MKPLWLWFVLGVVSWAEDGTSAARLDQAQEGMAESSWPKKPDDRLSPFSGKMKKTREISMRHYGQENELCAESAEGWQKRAAVGAQPRWEGDSNRRWEGVRWGKNVEVNDRKYYEGAFQPNLEFTGEQTLPSRQLKTKATGEWTSRSSRLANGETGSLRRYEGRLTRVREQVWAEETSGDRDLGSGRQEKYSPEEVQKLLAQPTGGARGSTKGQSPAAVRRAVADN